MAVEADWPDADRASRWAQGRSDDADAEEALRGFRRFPTWMWRNTVVVDFIGWLRSWNESSRRAPVGFHGMDLYSLYGSIDAVLRYLKRTDPKAADRARERYACFEAHEEAELHRLRGTEFPGLEAGCGITRLRVAPHPGEDHGRPRNRDRAVRRL